MRQTQRTGNKLVVYRPILQTGSKESSWKIIQALNYLHCSPPEVAWIRHTQRAPVIACKGSGLHHGHLVRYFSLCFISCKLYTYLCKVSTPLCKCPALLCNHDATCVTSTLNCVESKPFSVTSTHI